MEKALKAWRFAHRDLSQTRCSETDVIPPLRHTWTSKPAGSLIFESITGNESCLVIATVTGGLFSLDLNGKLIWHIRPGKKRKYMSVVHVPVIIDDLVIVPRFGCLDAYCMTDGAHKWRLESDERRIGKARHPDYFNDVEFEGGVCGTTNDNLIIASRSAVLQWVNIRTGRVEKVRGYGFGKVEPAGNHVIGQSLEGYTSLDVATEKLQALDVGQVRGWNCCRVNDNLIVRTDEYLSSTSLVSGLNNWRLNLISFGKVITDGKRVYVVLHEQLAAYDVQFGTRLWISERLESDRYQNEFSCSTSFVYATRRRGFLDIFDSANGKIIWSGDLKPEFPIGGPCLIGKHLFVAEEKSIICLESVNSINRDPSFLGRVSGEIQQFRNIRPN